MNLSAYATDFGMMFSFATTNWFTDAGSLMACPDDSGGNFAVAFNLGGGRNGGTFTRPGTGLHYYVFTYNATATGGGALGVAALVDNSAASITQNQSAAITGSVFATHKFSIMADASLSVFPQASYADEVRVSKGIRSADWCTTEYNNQNSPGTFMSLGTEVAL